MTGQPKEPMHDQLRRALPDQPELATALSESITEAMMRNSSLYDVGAREDEMGMLVFDNAKVNFYGGEIDIVTDKGFISFDVPIGEVHVKPRDAKQLAAVRGWYREVRAWFMVTDLLAHFTRDELHDFIDNLDESALPEEYTRATPPVSHDDEQSLF